MTDHLLKVEASGNDFIVGCGRWAKELCDDIDVTRRLCHRRLGLGADGTLAIQVRAADMVHLLYRNADGSRAEFCANGTRCAARVAHEILGLRSRLRIETDWTTIGAIVEAARVQLELPAADGDPAPLELEAGERVWSTWFVRVGVPHLVVPVDGPVANFPIERFAPALRHHNELGAEGANVNFVQVNDPVCISVRAWERGIEGETLSCGSGVIASALWHMQNTTNKRVVCRTRSGDDLEVEEAGKPSDRPLRLTGPARILADIEPLNDLI